MECPHCKASVGSGDMVSLMDCTSFICPQCAADLQVTTVSQVIIVAVGMLVATPVLLVLLLLGVPAWLAFVADALSFVSVCYVCFGHLSALEAQGSGQPTLRH